MAKSTLTFTLPEEQHEFHLAANAVQLADAVSTMSEWFRQQLKHGNHKAKTAKVLEEGRAMLSESIDGINLYG